MTNIRYVVWWYLAVQSVVSVVLDVTICWLGHCLESTKFVKSRINNSVNKSLELLTHVLFALSFSFWYRKWLEVWFNRQNVSWTMSTLETPKWLEILKEAGPLFGDYLQEALASKLARVLPNNCVLLPDELFSGCWADLQHAILSIVWRLFRVEHDWQNKCERPLQTHICCKKLSVTCPRHSLGCERKRQNICCAGKSTFPLNIPKEGNNFHQLSFSLLQDECTIIGRKKIK